MHTDAVMLLCYVDMLGSAVDKVGVCCFDNAMHAVYTASWTASWIASWIALTAAYVDSDLRCCYIATCSLRHRAANPPWHGSLAIVTHVLKDSAHVRSVLTASGHMPMAVLELLLPDKTETAWQSHGWCNCYMIYYLAMQKLHS